MKILKFIFIMLLLIFIAGGCDLFSTKDDKSEKITSNDKTIADVYKTEIESLKPKLTPAEAKSIIENIAKEVTKAIATKNMDELSKYIHPEKGVRFGLYGGIDKDSDLFFTPEQIKNFLNDKKIYFWGESAGSGEPIQRTATDYFNQFVYHSDFSIAEKISYNETSDNEGYPVREFKEYPNAIIVMYFFAGKTNPFDWKSDRIIFEEYNGNWYVVGFCFKFWSP